LINNTAKAVKKQRLKQKKGEQKSIYKRLMQALISFLEYDKK
jgi:hypothetical protein